MLGWWYTEGWNSRIGRSKKSILDTSELFSIGQLAATLFSPFRQISAGKVRGPIGVQLRAFADQLISRVIGGIVRFFMIIFGVIAISANTLFQAVIIIFWLTMPLLIIVGLLLAVIGWVPSWK